MKNSVLFCFLMFIVGLISCNDNKPMASSESSKPTTPVTENPIKRGEYLVKIAGCNDCHSPKKMGAQGPELIPELMLSGFPSNTPVVTFTDKMIKQGFAQFYPDLTAAAGPWGVSFAANITPDETGIGNWTEEQFKKALTQGKSKGLDNGRILLPPMPWQNYVNVPDEDVKAIFAYLKSINPVKNLVPAPITPDKI